MKLECTLLGESRTLAIKWFLSLQCALRSKGKFENFIHIMQEYFTMGHAEPVVKEDLNTPCQDVHYLPMHVVKSETSMTSEIRVVFDASAKATSRASLNDQLLVRPTVHSSLIDVLIRFVDTRLPCLLTLVECIVQSSFPRINAIFIALCGGRIHDIHSRTTG